MAKAKNRFKYVFILVIVYLLVGFLYGMAGEFRLAKKYGNSAFSALTNPYAYLRSIVSAPLWPIDLYWTLYHCGNLFGYDGRIK